MRSLRILIVAETYYPYRTGVANSVAHLADEAVGAGHEVRIVAPGPRCDDDPPQLFRVRSASFPLYPPFRVGVAGGALDVLLEDFRPDVVHLASPFFLGMAAAKVARRLGIPTVAVFQTDYAKFLTRYSLGWTTEIVWRWLRHLHSQADLTLAPSEVSRRELVRRGIEPVAIWGRGVDATEFSPARRSREFQSKYACDGELLVGYVGRLAREKRIEKLRAIADVAGLRLLLVGSGPDEARLRRLLPEAAFIGDLSGEDLAVAYASLDIAVQFGEGETFCQSAQEALASGVCLIVASEGGVRERVESGRTGLVVNIHNASDIRDTFVRLQESLELRTRIAAEAVASVEGNSWARVCTQLFEQYDALMRAEGSGRVNKPQ